MAMLDAYEHVMMVVTGGAGTVGGPVCRTYPSLLSVRT